MDVIMLWINLEWYFPQKNKKKHFMSKIFFVVFWMSFISGVDKDTLKWVKVHNALKQDDFNQGNLIFTV